MTDNQVGVVPRDNLGIVEDVVHRLRREDGFRERIELFLKGEIQISAEALKRLSRPFAQLEKQLSKRFGKAISVDSYPREFTDEFLAKAAQFNLRPVFLPGEEIGQQRLLKKWIKPAAWFYEQVQNGKVKPYDGYEPTTLRRGWYLVDYTLGVNYTDGTQVMPSDPWASLITSLRAERRIGKYDQTPPGSRFAVTHDEWESVVLTYMASKIGVPRAHVRLERAIEFNAIGDLYDRNRGKFNMWEWFADRFGDSDRLIGGFRDVGGLADVSCYWSDRRDGYIAARPLVSFVS